MLGKLCLLDRLLPKRHLHCTAGRSSRLVERDAWNRTQWNPSFIYVLNPVELYPVTRVSLNHAKPIFPVGSLWVSLGLCYGVLGTISFSQATSVLGPKPPQSVPRHLDVVRPRVLGRANTWAEKV